MYSRPSLDEMLQAGGCGSWRTGADAIVNDFEKACREAASRYPYTTDATVTTLEGQEDNNKCAHGNEMRTTTASSAADHSRIPSSSYVSFPTAFADTNAVGCYAKVYALCRSAKRCNGMSVVDYLLERLEEAFECWTRANMASIGLADDTQPILTDEELGTASPTAATDKQPSSPTFTLPSSPTSQSVESELVSRVRFGNLAMFARRYFHIKKFCKLQFLYINHNSKEAVQILLRKGLRNNIQSGLNETVICRHLEAQLSRWVRSVVDGGGDFSLSSLLQLNEGKLIDATEQQQQQPHYGPAFLVAMLDDLSLHRIPNAFCRNSEALIREFASVLALMASEAHVDIESQANAATLRDGQSQCEETSSLPSEESLLEASTARLIHLHGLLRQAEALLVNFLVFRDSYHELSMPRVSRCLGALFEGAALSPQITGLIGHVVGPLFISAAIMGNPNAHGALQEIVRGLCATHASFVGAVCNQIDAHLLGYLDTATAPSETATESFRVGGSPHQESKVRERERPEQYYRRFFETLNDTFVRAFGFFMGLGVPADSPFFGRLTVTFKRFVDAKESICVPSFALALHAIVKGQQITPSSSDLNQDPDDRMKGTRDDGEEGSASPSRGRAAGLETLRDPATGKSYQYAPITDETIDPFLRLVSFLGPKDFFVEAFSQTLAADGLMIAELGVVTDSSRISGVAGGVGNTEQAVGGALLPTSTSSGALPPRLLLEWERYACALRVLSNSISPSLCSAPLAMLNDMRLAARPLPAHIFSDYNNGGPSPASLLPFDCSMATLCIARWRHFSFPLLVLTTAQLAAERQTGGAVASTGARGREDTNNCATANGSTSSHDLTSLSPHFNYSNSYPYSTNRWIFGPFGPIFKQAAELLASTDTRVLTWIMHAGSVVVDCKFLTPTYAIRLTCTPCYALILGVVEGMLAEEAHEARFATPNSPTGPSFAFSPKITAVSNIPCIAKEAVVAACPWLPPQIVRRFIAKMTHLGFFESCAAPTATKGASADDDSNTDAAGASDADAKRPKSSFDGIPLPTTDGGKSQPTPAANRPNSNNVFTHMRLHTHYRGPQGRKVKVLLHTEELAAAVAAATARIAGSNPLGRQQSASGWQGGVTPQVAGVGTSGGKGAPLDPFSQLTSIVSTFGDSMFSNAVASGSFSVLQPTPIANDPNGNERQESGDAGGGLPHPSHTIAVSDKVISFRMRTMEAFIVRIMKEVQLISHEHLMTRALKEMSQVGPLNVAQFKQCVQNLISRDYMRRGEGGGYEYIA